MSDTAITEALNADNSVERMRQLMDKWFNPNEHLGYSGTPLTMAVEWGDIQVAKLLLEKGGDPNMPASIHHQTAVRFAVQNEDEPMIELLLANGGELRQSGALHQAALQLNPAVVRLLLRHGADPLEVRNEDGSSRSDYESLTALHCAVRPQVDWQHKEARLDQKPHLETVQALWDGGVDVHAKNGSGFTALEIARSNNEFPNVIALLGSWGKSSST